MKKNKLKGNKEMDGKYSVISIILLYKEIIKFGDVFIDLKKLY